MDHSRADCGWQRTDSGLMEKVNWVLIYNYNGSDWEIPGRVRYDAERQAKGCKFKISRVMHKIGSDNHYQTA